MAQIIVQPATNLTVSQIEALQDENWQLKRALEKARKELHLLCRCTTFQILTREGLELQWQQIKHAHPSYSLIMLDIDRLKQLNAQYGIIGANKLIYSALNCVRSSELVGRAFMGDEIACIVKSHLAELVCARIVDGFREQRICVTTAIGQCVSESLAECIAPLVAEVEAKKLARTK